MHQMNSVCGWDATSSSCEVDCSVLIDAAHAGEPNEDELLGKVGYQGMETGHLPVELIAIQSVLTAKHDEQWLAALSREPSSLTIISQPN